MSFSFFPLGASFGGWSFLLPIIQRTVALFLREKKCHVQRSGKQLVQEINCSATTDVVAKTYSLGDWSAFFVFVNTKSAVLTD